MSTLNMASSSSSTLLEDSNLKEQHPILDSSDHSKDGNVDGVEKKTIGNIFRETFPSVYARRGLLWLSVAIFFQSAQIVALADITNKMGATQALFFRSLFLITTVVGVSWKESESYNLSDMLLFILSSVSDVVFVYGIILASKFIWTGDITSISLNQQIPSALLACILLGEALDTLDGFFVVLNALGVVLVSQPSFIFSNSHHFGDGSGPALPGYLLAFVSLAGTVGNILFYRILVHRKREDPFLLPTLTGMIGLLISSFVAAITASWEFPESMTEWSVIIVLGAFALLTFLPLVKSLETENVKTVTVMLTVTIPLTTLYDFIALRRDLNLAKIGGVLLILGSSFGLHIKATWIS